MVRILVRSWAVNMRRGFILRPIKFWPGVKILHDVRTFKPRYYVYFAPGGMGSLDLIVWSRNKYYPHTFLRTFHYHVYSCNMRQRGMVSPYESFISCRNRRFENCSSGRYSVISPWCGFCLFKQQPLAKSPNNRSGNNELLMIFHTGHFCHFSGSLFSSRSCAFVGICG